MNKNLRILVLLLSTQLWLTAAQAAVPVGGVVRDPHGTPVVGATLIEKGTQNGTVTLSDGSFSLPVRAADAVIAVSCLGFRTEEVALAGRTHVEIVLTEDTQLMDEVVVVGYGVQKKVSVTGSVAAIGTEQLEKAPADNLSNLLGGKLPGLISRQTTGLPGENESTLYIRGISTTGTSTPLVLVDGIERDFTNLDPSEIANITILKDAASAAVYGVRGANGVVLVTTRRGAGDTRPTVSYNGAFTMSFNANMPEFLDGVEYATWHNRATDLDGTIRQFSDTEIGYIRNGNDPQGVFGNTDWFDLVFKDFAAGQSHTVNITGGTPTVKYFVGGSMLQQDGIIDRVSFDRYNLRSNLDINLSKRLVLKVDVSGRLEKRRQGGITAGSSDPTASLDNGGATEGYKNVVFYAISAKPTVRPRTPDGQYIGYMNPLLVRDESGFTRRDGSFVQTSLSLAYDIPGVEGLRASALYSYDFQNSLYKQLLLPSLQVTPQYGDRTDDGVRLTEGYSPHLSSGLNKLTDSHTWFARHTFQAMLNYAHAFGKHDVSADLVWEQSGARSRSMSAAKQNLPVTEIPDLDFGTEVVPNSVRGSHGQSGRAGVVFRGTYAYDNRYMLQASVRADWSAKFARGNRMGVFPAVSAGWRISEERFFAPVRKVVDNLKLRVSWGILGNDAIEDFLYMQGISLSSTPTVILDGVPSQSLSTTSIPNKDITWEQTTTWNAGMDLSLWGGRLTFEGDVFYKVTRDILQSQAGQQPPSIGGNYPAIINGGIVDVKGCELVVGHRNRYRDFSYGISANFSFARSRYVSTNESANIPAYQSRIGQPLGAVLGYVSEGLYQSEEELALLPRTSDAVRLGDIRYRDLNGDGKITADDRTWIARNQIPEIMFGLNLDFSYKWADLSLFFQGASNTDVMLSGTYSALGYSDGTYFTQAFKWGSNPPKYLVEGSWTPEHRNAEYPRLSTASNSNNALVSDFWSRNASYLRLKSVQLGFTLPERWTRKFFVQKLRVYLSGSNLMTFSKLKYIDPEAPSVNNGYYPQQRVVSIGANVIF